MPSPADIFDKLRERCRRAAAGIEKDLYEVGDLHGLLLEIAAYNVPQPDFLDPEILDLVNDEVLAPYKLPNGSKVVNVGFDAPTQTVTFYYSNGAEKPMWWGSAPDGFVAFYNFTTGEPIGYGMLSPDYRARFEHDLRMLATKGINIRKLGVLSGFVTGNAGFGQISRVEYNRDYLQAVRRWLIPDFIG